MQQLPVLQTFLILLGISMAFFSYYSLKRLAEALKKKKPKVYESFFYTEGWAVPMPYRTKLGSFLKYCLHFDEKDDEIRGYKKRLITYAGLCLIALITLIFIFS